MPRRDSSHSQWVYAAPIWKLLGPSCERRSSPPHHTEEDAQVFARLAELVVVAALAFASLGVAPPASAGVCGEQWSDGSCFW